MANQYDVAASAAEKKTFFAHFKVHRMHPAYHAFHIHFTALQRKKKLFEKKSKMKNSEQKRVQITGTLNRFRMITGVL